MKIIVPDGYTLNPGDNPWDPVAALGELIVHDRTPDDQMVERALDADILILNKAPLNAAAIAQLPRLKFITVTATGYNIVDAKAAAARGIPVSNVPEYGTRTVAQFTIALLLELCHRAGDHSNAVIAGQWAACPDFCFWNTPQMELDGKVLGIIGFGRIGKQVARIAHAMGMQIIAAGRSGQTGTSAEPPARLMSVREVFSAADVVSLHCPLTPENTGMVDRNLLGLMKPSAFLINSSRGQLINEQHLANALNSGTLAGAAVDVVSAEPIRKDNPLLSAKNCIVTPHMAWASLAARKRVMKATAENINGFLSGRKVNVVNGV